MVMNIFTAYLLHIVLYAAAIYKVRWQNNATL